MSENDSNGEMSDLEEVMDEVSAIEPHRRHELTPPEGSSYRKYISEFRAAIHRAVSVEDIEEIIRTQVEKAKGGHQAATRLILEYCIGKPTTADTDKRPTQTFHFQTALFGENSLPRQP